MPKENLGAKLMLTITETIDAIKSLDTDEDIILGACNRIISKDKIANDPQSISIEIVEKYAKRLSSSEFLEMLCLTTAVTAVSSCKPGHGPKLLEVLLSSISSKFITAYKDLFLERLANNPSKGLDELLEMIEQLKELKTKKD